MLTGMKRDRRRSVELVGPFRGSEAVNEGLLSQGELRGPRYVRLFRDVYLPAGRTVTYQIRCRAAAMIVPSAAVLTGRSAAAIRGVELAPDADPVEFVVDDRHRFGPIKGMLIKRTELRLDDFREWHGIRIATGCRMALDLASNRPLRQAVADLDAVLRAGLVDQDLLCEHLAGRHGHGIVRAREAARLADPRSQSRPESELRVILANAGLHPRPQVEIWDGSIFVARVDLAFEDCGVAVEYDGAWHALREQLAKDRKRIARLHDLGWEIVHVTADQLYGDPDAIVATVQRAMGRATRRLSGLRPYRAG